MSSLICDVPIRAIDVQLGLQDPILLQQQFFSHGFVHVRGVVQGEELAVLRRETESALALARQWQPTFAREEELSNGEYHNQVNHWVQQNESLPPIAQDTYYFPTKDGLTPRAIDFIPAHCPSARALLGHPNVLRVVEALQGSEFILGATPMVVKFPDDGAEMPWHRDGLRPKDIDKETATFTAGIYLDDANDETAVRVVPGSHLWPSEDAGTTCRKRNQEQLYNDDECMVALPQAGDLLIHHTWLLHGSPASRGPMRRVIYESFTPLEIASQLLVDTQLHLAHRRIHLGIMERQYQSYSSGEESYRYNCNLSDYKNTARRWQDLDVWRLHHGAFRRSS